MDKRCTALLAASLALSPALADAQEKPPKFEFAEPEEVEGVEWKASAQAGLVATTGNSRNTTLTGSGKLSRKERANKFTLDASGSYARSSIFIALDANNDGVIDASELQRDSTTTAKNWNVRARYDRFLTETNALFVLASVGADEPAGKEFIAGGQLGYSRSIYKDDIHDLIAELGYDFTYEALLAGGDPLSIHSGRAFASYAVKPRESAELAASVEALVNVNRLETVAGEIAPGEDTRINGMFEATASLTERLSLSASFQARFDNAPAPLPPLSIPFAPGFVPVAEELDTITKVTLLVNFL